MAKGSLHGSPSGHEVVGDDGKGGTSNEEVTLRVFRERGVPTRAGFYLRGPSYSGGRGGGGWEEYKAVKSGAGSGMPVGAALLVLGFLLKGESAQEAGGKGGLVH